MASTAASVTQTRAQSEAPTRNSFLAPPVAKPRQLGPRSSQPVTVSPESVCAAHMLPCGPSRSRPWATIAAMMRSGMCRGDDDEVRWLKTAHFGIKILEAGGKPREPAIGLVSLRGPVNGAVQCGLKRLEAAAIASCFGDFVQKLLGMLDLI